MADANSYSCHHSQPDWVFGPTGRLNSAEITGANSQASSRRRRALDGVPSADMNSVHKVASLEAWKNPFLVVRPEGVELVSSRGSSGANSVSVDRMREILVSLPTEAWPLGRVVAVQELGIRSGNDDELIAANVKALERMLSGLGVQINWWPTA